MEAVIEKMYAPFPYFGGKRDVAQYVWDRFGHVKHYIEPFCGSIAMLLQAPYEPSLQVVNDMNGFIANFWRATVNQPEAVARWADYPVSHVDMGVRHKWLMAQRPALAERLADVDWTGDAKIAGWWLWGQCAWIGSGWCDWFADRFSETQIPHVSDAGRGYQAIGKVPHVSDAGMGYQAIGRIPHVSDAGRHFTSQGEAAHEWLCKLSKRLGRVRVIHGDWSRCLNNHYGGDSTAVFLDPPYIGYEGVYGAAPIATEVAAWCRENQNLRIALCGHIGEHEMDGWHLYQWDRSGNTYGSDKTKDQECIWFSPACIPPTRQMGLL